MVGMKQVRLQRNDRNRHVDFCPPDKCSEPNVELALDVMPGEGPPDSRCPVGLPSDKLFAAQGPPA